jgi:hypothetical protein
MENDRYYFERVLFVVGEQNSGKSTQLRSLFLDVRFGKGGSIPQPGNLPEIYRLSNERSLYLRMTSPHETGEYLVGPPDGEEGTNFLDKTKSKIKGATPHYGRRWNFACPLQPDKSNNMPNVVNTVNGFIKCFCPERSRVLFLSPDRHGNHLQDIHLREYVTGLHQLPSVEVAWIDASDRTKNGLLIADFFDFT